MKVSIVVGGRFFAFDVARALHKRGALGAIVSAYPGAFRERIGPRHLRWNPWLGMRQRLATSGTTGPRRDAIEFEYAVRFGRWAARRLNGCDVVQAWTGYGLESLVEGRRGGATTIALRASSHILTQAMILDEEYHAFGWKSEPVSQPMIDRELAEYEAADYVNVISTFAYRSFVERGFPESKLILTPIAVDIEEVAWSGERAPGEGPLRALFLGTTCLRKGIHYLLEAAEGLGHNAIQVSLVGGITGDGREILRRRGAEAAWKGSVPRSELGALFAHHDVLVLPSIEDGFGAVICEAMAAGLPVIATENTGAPDVVRDGVDGFIVPARSAAALAAALATLVDDRARGVSMGKSGAERMRARATWDHFVDDMLARYAAADRVRRGARDAGP